MSLGSGNIVLVTGASGMIGRACVEELLKAGYRVRAQVRNKLAFEEILKHLPQELLSKLETFQLDLLEYSQPVLDKLSAACSAIVHCAGLVHKPEASFQEYDFLNIRFSQALAEAAARNGVQYFVFLSTSAVYGPGPFVDIDESGPLNAKTPYAISKLKTEEFLQGFESIGKKVVLRPSLVYGPGDRGNVASLIRQISKGKYFHIGRAQTRKSLIYSYDLARIICALLEAQLNSSYIICNVAADHPVSTGELANCISRAVGKNGQLPSLPESAVRLIASIGEVLLGNKFPLTAERIEKLTTETTLNTDLLRQVVRTWTATDLVSGLKSEYDWFCSKQS
jgi:nucleoside-diphosphate-sugar epimerase